MQRRRRPPTRARHWRRPPAYAANWSWQHRIDSGKCAGPATAQDSSGRSYISVRSTGLDCPDGLTAAASRICAHGRDSLAGSRGGELRVQAAAGAAVGCVARHGRASYRRVSASCDRIEAWCGFRASHAFVASRGGGCSCWSESAEDAWRLPNLLNELLPGCGIASRRADDRARQRARP